MSAHPEPTPDQLRAMAYTDGELPPEDRAAFEARLAAEPTLAREVTQYQRLALVTRSAAPPEPMDHEWRRLEADPLQRAGTKGGMLLFFGGAIGLAVWLLLTFLTDDSVSPIARALIAALAGGLTALFLTVLRGRLRTLPYDAYTDVKR